MNTTKSTIIISKPKNDSSDFTLSSFSSNKANAASNNTQVNELAITNDDSSGNDTDSVAIMNDDIVSDDMNPDSRSRGGSEDSNHSTSSYCSSTATSIDSDSNSSSLESVSNTSVSNISFLITLKEEEDFLNEAFGDPTILLYKIHSILTRIRKLVMMIYRSSILNRYVTKEMKQRIQYLNRQIKDPTNYIKFQRLIIDMKIRWNSTYIMITRFLFYSSIITSLTHDPSKKIKLQSFQYRKLKQLSFSSLDWLLLKALELVLKTFNDSTKILSTRTRPTMSMCQSIIHALNNFLSKANDTPLTLESLLKKQLLLNFNFYLEKHISDKQSRVFLVSKNHFCFLRLTIRKLCLVIYEDN